MTCPILASNKLIGGNNTLKKIEFQQHRQL